MPGAVRHPGVRGRGGAHGVTPPVAIALVHHGNQLVITDGYEDRDGITAIVAGFERLLALHERYAIPLGLHLSGTLLEAVAWYQPRFLERVKELRASGLVWLPGGAYAEHVMPLFDAAFNREQLEEQFALYEHLLDCPPEHVTVCWIPERVWDTDRLAPVLANPELPNGGYRHVLLDDRLLFATNGDYAGSPRATFDALGPFDRPGGDVRPEACRAYVVAGGHGLTMVPISAHLRYWIPPRRPEHLPRLEASLLDLAEAPGDATLLCYADDLEKAAGVAGWNQPISRYARFLEWLVDHPELAEPVALDDWLERNPPAESRVLEPGTFFELAHGWGAGEDYRGWSDCAAWAPLRGHFTRAQEAVAAARCNGADPRLMKLAGKHLLASAHETGWQDAAPAGDGRAPAPWARAVASHARACLPMVAAAEALAGGAANPVKVEITDADSDGEDELVLSGPELYAVVSPRHGGRVVLLFHRTEDGGALSVGNPTDHWNFQEELNRYMDRPANHPGAFADVGLEHEPWRIAETGERWARMEAEGELRGARKTLVVARDAPALVVCYELPAGGAPFATEACLSPDYLSLLRDGRGGIQRCGGTRWRGFRNGSGAVWLAHAADEPVRFTAPARQDTGHGLNVRVEADTTHFHLLIGCGPADDRRCRRLLEEGRELLRR